MSPKDEFIKKIGSRVEDGEVLLGLLFENLHLQTIIQTVCSEARPKYIGFSPKDLMLRFTEELVSGGSSGLDWLFSRDEAAFASLFKCLKEIDRCGGPGGAARFAGRRPGLLDAIHRDLAPVQRVVSYVAGVQIPAPAPGARPDCDVLPIDGASTGYPPSAMASAMKVEGIEHRAIAGIIVGPEDAGVHARRHHAAAFGHLGVFQMGEGTDRLSRAPLRRCHARENDAREHHGDRWSGMDEAGHCSPW